MFHKWQAYDVFFRIFAHGNELKHFDTRTRMMTMRHVILSVLCLCCVAATAKTYTLTSPNGRLRAEVSDGVRYSLYSDGVPLMTDCRAGIDIEGETWQGKILSARRGSKRESVDATFYRQSRIEAECNTLTLSLGGGVSMELRAYNEGMAYRFATTRRDSFTVENEVAEFCFTDDFTAYLAHSNNEKRPFATSFENTYTVAPLGQQPELQAFLPTTVDCGDCKLTLMEADLEAYPGMFVVAGEAKLTGLFAPYPKTTGYWPGRKQMYVKETLPYIARCVGTREFPWRIVAVSYDDRDMPVNNLVYLLASPNRIGDTQWVMPGKVAWDWWNDWGLEHVPFAVGINTDTYKHYIDFAAKYGLEYVILDEGWYDPEGGDMLTTVSELDLPELVRYGQEKGVGLVLWTVFNVLDDQLNEACRLYEEMGIKGFKPDFMDRDDQTAVEMLYRVAARCAEHHLILDCHGIFKPTGINRTYPNIVNYESIFGMEQTKWIERGVDMPLFDVTFPFIRMQTGFMDFTPGGMRNATRADYQPVYSNPMTMGTRCHQAAMYVIHDSPFTMLADSPSAYERDTEYTRFIASIPTHWDETIIPLGKIGEYIVTARRLGDTWYVAGQTNWDERTLHLDFGFLGEGLYEADMLTDGGNANKVATDYRLTKEENLSNTNGLDLHMASGGGFVMILTRATCKGT